MKYAARVCASNRSKPTRAARRLSWLAVALWLAAGSGGTQAGLLSVSASVTGPLSATSVSVAVSADPADRGAQKSLWIAAAVPGWADLYFRTGDGSWVAWTGGNAPAAVLSTGADSITVDLLGGTLNLTGLPGTQVYVGFGGGWAQMLDNGDYALAYTVPTVPASGKVFALMDPGEASSSMRTYAAMASVDGLAYRSLWRALEPQAGVYDWSSLDAAFDAVRGQGKSLTLHVATDGQALPSWLASVGAAYYTASSPVGPVSGAVPWDAVYLQRIKSFVSALGAHVRDRGDLDLLAAVSDGAPMAEMSLVGCQNNMLGSYPYSRSAYLQAWQQSASAYLQAFPGKRLLISAPVRSICANDEDGQAFYTDVMNDALGQSAAVGVFAADLMASGTGSQRMGQVDASVLGRSSVNFQMLAAYSTDSGLRMKGTLNQAVCDGWNLNGRYFEVYKADLQNPAPDVQEAVARARTGAGC